MRPRLASSVGIASVIVLALSIMTLPACGDDDPVAGPVSTGNGQPPNITRVSWTQDPGCVPNTPNGVTIVVTVNDPDTTPGDLTYSGSVTSCGPITGATTVVICPQLGNYAASVTVRDPEGNSDTATFAFGPCQDGQTP